MAETTLQKSTREKYEEVLPQVCEQFGIKNKFAAPRITKVCLNMGVGRAIADGQILNIVSEHLSLLAGQRSSITIAKKAVAQFRSREGNKIGAKVTLRGPKMWNFLDKLIHLA
ncbi:MAG: 50S ribosomal protein L5, partial [Planctomycetes bacterium]|nr:50S ribosomal protein L5 [Planctomycetota bacterium]